MGLAIRKHSIGQINDQARRIIQFADLRLDWMIRNNLNRRAIERGYSAHRPDSGREFRRG